MSVISWIGKGSERWKKMGWRMVVIAQAFIVSALVFVAVPASAQASCTDTELRNHMTCETNPKVSKCVLSVGAAGGVGFIFGGPLGFLAGVVGAGVSCAIDTID